MAPVIPGLRFAATLAFVGATFSLLGASAFAQTDPDDPAHVAPDVGALTAPGRLIAPHGLDRRAVPTGPVAPTEGLRKSVRPLPEVTTGPRKKDKKNQENK